MMTKDNALKLLKKNIDFLHVDHLQKKYTLNISL